jgi:hypothetical protein
MAEREHFCPGCSHYQADDPPTNGKTGTCRIAPPAADRIGSEQKDGRAVPVVLSYWPAVGAGDWCSRFNPG